MIHEKKLPKIRADSTFKKWAPLFVMGLALTIIILDTTILNVTLRTIIGDLHTTIQKIQWVITAYSLMLAAFTVTGGRLGDLFGRKRMFILGAVIFAIGSFITSESHTVGVLIAGEAIIEGIGAVLMMPATASLLRATYGGRDRQIAFGIWGGLAAGASALGPVIGGWLATYYSWRWAFRINVFVAFVLVASSVIVKESVDTEEKPTFDWLGVILSALGLLSLVYGFIETSSYGWLFEKNPFSFFGYNVHFGGYSPSLIFIALGLLILILFGFLEAYMERKGRTPLVSLKLFRNSRFMSGNAIISILSLGLGGLTFTLPIFLQSVLKLDPVQTGIAMIPLGAAVFVAAPSSAYFSKFISPRLIIQSGIALNILGFFLLRSGLGVNSTVWSLVPGFAVFGFGMGFMMAQTSNLTLSAVSVQQAGEASGVNNTFRQLGSTLGIAILGAILLSSLTAKTQAGIMQSTVIPASEKTAISSAVTKQISNIEFGSANQTGIPPAIASEIGKIAAKATVDADRETLLYGAIFSALSFIATFWLPKGKQAGAERDLPKSSL